MNNALYKLISFDLDGTLLRDDKTISKETVNVLNRLSKDGYIIVISTGRSMVGIPDEIKKIKTIDYFITSNGASCVDRNGKYLIKNWINYNDIKELVADKNFFVEYLISGKWYISSEDLNQIPNIIEDKSIVEYILSTRNIIHDNLDDLHIEKINLNFSKNNYDYALNKIEDFIKRQKNLRAWTDKKHKMDIYNIEATKGNVLKSLASFHHIELSEIISFGDDDNDLEMLTSSGCSVAMKNSSDMLKKVAMYTTRFDNNNDGVAEFIKQYKL